MWRMSNVLSKNTGNLTSYDVLRERKEALIDLDIDRLIPVVYLSSHRNREVELGDYLNIPPLIS